jgi:hypothetical protein
MRPLPFALALLLLTAALAAPADEKPAVKAPDWVKVTDKAGWQARDSQGEVVFNDRLWVMGGWFDSFSPPPRDVWSSADGRTWELVQKAAPWKHSDLPMTVVFGGKMWTMGGWYNGRLKDHSASNEVWYSADGKDWVQATAKAAWTPRIAAGLVEFKGKLWLLGGTEDYYFGTDKSLKNDVWYSENGKDWTLATADAGWSPRAYHQAVVHAGKLWVMGGGNYTPKYHAVNDVWSSEDGVKWTKVTDKAAWHERLWFSAVVYRDRMWVLGGWSSPPYTNWGDVWYSKDGKTWTEYRPAVCWKARHEHSAYVWKDKIWVAGGHAQPLNSEVWSLDVPKDWFKDK